MDERLLLLSLARRTVREAATTRKLPVIEGCGVPPRFREPKACFVTLRKHGKLRGCVGELVACKPLYLAVINNACSAATRDSRFTPVESVELPDLQLQISVLTALQPLEFSSPEDLIRKVRPRVDGVMLQIGLSTSTFLPQVWEDLPDPVEFLNHLALKAGAAKSDWRRSETRISTYRTESFSDPTF